MANTTRFMIEIPDVGLDSDTWGNILNNYLNALEPLVFDKRGDTVNGNLTVTGSTSVTTLAASGALTLTGGTANGVAYLNGSKVLTTGSGLTYNGTNLLSLTSGAIRLTDEFELGWGANSVFLTGSSASNTLQFITNSSEQMRLTSTGLGIGTSSPARRFHASTGAAAGVALFESTAGNTVAIGLKNTTSSAIFPQVLSIGDSILFQTVGSNRAEIDSSGNLGLGVTPSAWATGFTALEGNSGSVVFRSANTGLELWQNAIFSAGSSLYKTTAAASRYAQQLGSHIWSTAPSGTAGAAINFTQAMTLTQGGNLLVGTTSNSFGEKFGVYSAGNVETLATLFSTGSTGTAKIAFLNGSNNSGVGGAGGDLVFYANDRNTERARITSAGNLLVGTALDQGYRVAARSISAGVLGESSNNHGLTLAPITSGQNVTNIYNANGATVFSLGGNLDHTQNNERARITSAGYFKASSTGVYNGAAASYHEFNNNSGAPTVLAYDSLSSSQGNTFFSKRVSTAGDHYLGETNGTTVYRVLANGNVQNASGAAISPISSDARIKQVTDTLDDALDVIAKLRPVKFDYMGKHESFGKNIYGFIAQEVGQAKPDAVMDSGLKDDDIPDLKTYDASFIVPYLVKALQQSNARVEQLESRIAALEAK
jgi:hypothetical protein